jgi:hypothetical protein
VLYTYQSQRYKGSVIRVLIITLWRYIWDGDFGLVWVISFTLKSSHGQNPRYDRISWTAEYFVHCNIASASVSYALVGASLQSTGLMANMNERQIYTSSKTVVRGEYTCWSAVCGPYLQQTIGAGYFYTLFHFFECILSFLPPLLSSMSPECQSMYYICRRIPSYFPNTAATGNNCDQCGRERGPPYCAKSVWGGGGGDSEEHPSVWSVSQTSIESKISRTRNRGDNHLTTSFGHIRRFINYCLQICQWV